MDDYELDDDPCPTCGHSPTRYRDCDQIGCDDGLIDLYEDDPVSYDPDDTEVCLECNGTGVQRFCSNCGWTNAGYVTAQSPQEEDNADVVSMMMRAKADGP